MSSNIFTLDITPGMTASGAWVDGALNHVTGGVTSVLLALRCKLVIHYVSGSQLAGQLAREVAMMYRRQPTPSHP